MEARRPSEAELLRLCAFMRLVPRHEALDTARSLCFLDLQGMTPGTVRAVDHALYFVVMGQEPPAEEEQRALPVSQEWIEMFHKWQRGRSRRQAGRPRQSMAHQALEHLRDFQRRHFLL